MRKRTYESPAIGVITCTLYGDIAGLVQGSGQQGATDTGGSTGGDGIYAKPRLMDEQGASQENADAPYALGHTSLWDD